MRSGPDLRRLRVLPPTPALKNGRRYLVGYVGVMGKQEGIDGLLSGGAAHRAGHEAHRHPVRPGRRRHRAARRCASSREQLGVADYVTFTGRVPDAELLAMLNTADVCVNPDVANDMNDKSTMNKIMEYMALGKPIVQFDLTEGRVSAQDASLYARRNDPIDMARKLVALLDDEELRSRMGAAGRERVKTELAWQHEAPRLLAAYEELFKCATSR